MLNLFSESKYRTFNKYKSTIRRINELAQEMEDWSDTQLFNQTAHLKQKFTECNDLDLLLPESFASLKEACRRAIGISLFDVQLLGGIVLHNGNIAEMKTGEGKTLAATLPAYLNSLTGEPVHVVTVNDYLAKRDSEWVEQIYNRVNIQVGLVQQDMSADARKQNYSKEIVYVTNSELGFDYLRDNMAIDLNDIVQKKFSFCIIDEVDSILIDEARTPLILSGPSQIATAKYSTSNLLCSELVNTLHYEIDEKNRSVILTDEGIAYCEEYLQIPNIYQIQDPWAQHLTNGLKAKELFVKDRHYIVKDKEVIIVDEFTGRIMPGRRWSDGLHQAVEAKENVTIQKENQTLASITYQNFFLLYKKLSGMTGTALTEITEFDKIYNINVVEVPTNKSCIRQDLADLVYKREYDKWSAIANECYDMYQVGRPTLIGTTNVEKSELLAKILDEYKIPYRLLNAKPENVEKESAIIAQAGQLNAVTIATNMAGRGTDIILGGNAKQVSRLLMVAYLTEVICNINIGANNLQLGMDLDQVQHIFQELSINITKDKLLEKIETNDQLAIYIEECLIKPIASDEIATIIKTAYEKLIAIYNQLFNDNRNKVIELGGLHVIGTERHESRRIDNQLRGRAGRQGDVGSSRFFLSLEDSLLRIFGGDKILRLMETLNIEDDTPIESKILSNSLDSAQKKVESYYYDIRKQLFEYDEVLNIQRQAIYSERNRILSSNYVRDCIIEYGESTIDEILLFQLTSNSGRHDNGDKNVRILKKTQAILNVPAQLDQGEIRKLETEDIRLFLYEQLRITYDLREAYLEQLRPGLIRQLEKYYLLQQIDKAWQEHLEDMSNLRESIGWRSYGQQDPLTEYKNEAFSLFLNMITYIRETVVYLIMRSKLVIDTDTRKDT